MSLTKLPIELISSILNLATDNPLRYSEESWNKTFSTTGDDDLENDFDDALRTKAVICLVNRLFKCLAEDLFLYEDVRVRHGSDALAELLEASADEHCKSSSAHHPLGLRVRRLCLYPAEEDEIRQHWSGTVNRNAHRILSLCTQVEILVRKNFPSFSSSKHFSFPSIDPNFKPAAVLPSVPLPDVGLTNIYADDILHSSLTRLKRVAWTCEEYSPKASAPTMSLPLPRFIWLLPSLRTLRIRGPSFPSLPPALHSLRTTSIHLPHLQTLQLDSYNALGMGTHHPRPTDIALPCLTHLVLGVQGAFYSAFESCLASRRFGITTLEFGCDESFLKPTVLQPLLRFFVNVEEVRVPVYTTAVRACAMYASAGVGAGGDNDELGHVHTVEQFPAVKRMVFSAAIPRKTMSVLKENRWKQIEGHLRHFTSPASERAFPEVRSITLRGEEWLVDVGEEDVFHDERFKALEDAIGRQGIELVRDFSG